MFISWAPSPVLSAGTSTSASTISITDSPTDITKSQLTAPNVTVSQKASELDAIFSDKTTTDLQVDVQTSEATLLIAGRSELSDEFRHQLDEWARSTSVNLETQSTDGSLATEGRPIVDSDLTLIAGINEVTTNGHQPDVNSDKYFQSSDFPDNAIFTRQQGVTDDVGVSGRLSDQNKILQRRPPTEGDHPVPGHGEEDVGNKEDVTKAEIREAGNEELPDASTSASASAGHIIMSAPGILHGHHAALNYSSLQQLPSLNLNMKNETKPSWKNETGERRAVAGSLYKCCWAQCEVAFGTLNQLVNHVNDIHVRIETDIEYRCQWENCPRKGKGFNARYKLLIHVRTHTNEKPHHCKLCDKSFARLENLKIHMRSHTGEKPYICPFEGCGKAYSNSSDRFKHVRTHQINKPYVCRMPGCGKSYTDPSSLRKHVKCHHHYWKGDDKQVDSSLSWTDDGCEELRMDTLPSDAAPASQLTDATSESHTATMPDDTNMTSISTIDAAVSAVSTSQCSTPTLVSLSATNGGFATLGGTLVPLAGATLQPQMISIQGNMLQVAALTANPLLSSAVILPNVSTTSTSTQTDAIISHLSDSTDKDIIALSNCVQESPLDLSTSPLPSHGEENSTDLTHFSAKWDLMATD